MDEGEGYNKSRRLSKGKLEMVVDPQDSEYLILGLDLVEFTQIR